MVRQDILGGLKLALSKGQSLESAMQSFYNSGYKKEDIEEAARELYSGFSQQNTQSQQSTQSPQKIQSIQPIPQTQPAVQGKKEQTIQAQPTLVKKPVQIQPVLQTSPQIQIQHKQIVSNYEQPRRKRIDFVTIMLVVILFALLGVLAAVFFFKPEIVEFLNKYLE